MARADPFAPLVRLRRFRLDEERRALAETVRRRDGLRAELQAVEAALASETAQAGDLATEAGWAFAAYAQAAIDRRSRMQQQIAQAEDEVAAARTCLLERWRELRAIELACEGRRRRTAGEAARLERLRLDETAATIWRRGQETQEPAPKPLSCPAGEGGARRAAAGG